MSGDPEEFTTPAGQEDQDSASLGEDINSLLGSLSHIESILGPIVAPYRLAASTAADQSSVRRTLSFTEQPPLADTQEEKEQESSTMANNNDADSQTAAIPAVIGIVDSILASSSMFAATPKDKTKLTGLVPSVARGDRGTSAKDKQKIKKAYTTSIPSPFDVPQHYVSSNLGESDGSVKIDSSNFHDVFIATAQKTKEFKIKCTSYDIINIMMIPLLKDADGTTPNDRWDFSSRTHFLDGHPSIAMKRCELWVSDCLLYDNSGFEAEDQEWLLECARNCCSADLRQKVDDDFEKLDVEFRGGITYLKLMFDVLVFVNDHVIVGMQGWLKLLGTKGLRMFKNESVRDLSIAALAICTQLSEASRLPEDAVQDILNALCICSHEGFRKQFDTLRTIRENSILGIGATSGTTLEQIKKILTEADKFYNIYSVNKEWKFGTAVYANACFNCGGNHGLQSCNKAHDDGRIERAKQEYQKKKGSGGFQKGNNNNGGSGNSGNGKKQYTNTDKNKVYGRGKFRKPDNPREGGEGRKIDGAIHLACAKCGWNDGNSKHTTKYHTSSKNANFALPGSHPAVLKWGLCAEVDSSGSTANQSTAPPPASGSSNFAAMCAQLKEMEKTSNDHEQVKFMGLLSSIFGQLKD